MVRFTVVLAILLALPASVTASTSNPPDTYLGQAGAVSCNMCHNSAQHQSGPGSLTLQGLPAKFEPGKSYPLTVKLQQAGAKKAGFRLAAQLPTGAQAGKIVNRDPSMDVRVTNGVTFLKQSYNGTTTNGSERSWTFLWKAPQTGTVVFSIDGVAGNDDGGIKGDNTYSFQATVEAGQPAVASQDAGKATEAAD